MPEQILTNACVLDALFRLTVNVRRINSGVQKKRWKKCPQGKFRIQRICPEYTAQQVKPDVRTLTLKDNAFAVCVKSGKNMTLKMWIQTITSVSTVEQSDLLVEFMSNL